MAVAIILTLVLGVAATGYALGGYGDGTGTMTVSPTPVAAGATGQTFTFVYTAAVDLSASNGSEVRVTVPAGWTAPQRTNANAAGYVSVNEVVANNCNPGTPTFVGMEIRVAVTCHTNDAFRIIYGTGPNGTVTVPTTPGTATFAAESQYGNGGSQGLATDPAVTITAAAANKLAFTTQPVNTTAGTAFAVGVTVQDTYGNTVTGSTASITIAPSIGTLNGTKTVNAVAGVATFPGLSINTSGSYTIGAAATGLASATSNSFTVAAGAANKLAFTTQPPASTAAGTAFTVVVTVQDSFGNTVTGSTASIGIGFGANPGSGTLSGTTTHNAVAGVATFNNLSINKAGIGYTLIASATGMNVTSSAFTITAAAASQLIIGQQPTNTTVGAAIAPPVTVLIEDQYGNVTTSTATVAIAIQTGTGTLSGTTSRAAVGGVATFNDLAISAAGNFTLRATSTGLTRVDSSLFVISLQPLTATFYTRICDSYGQAPADREPTTNYGGGWSGNDTGGHNGQLNTSFQTSMTNNGSDLVCDPYTGTWTFNMWDGQDGTHKTGGNPNLVGTATTSGASGSGTITLNAAELTLARGAGLWITAGVNQNVAGFASIRCYNDIHYSDNSETVVVPNGTSGFVCIVYNVKPKITFAAIAAPTFGDGPITLGATTTATGAGVAVTYTASGACSATGNLLTINAAGSCTVVAHEAQVPGTSNFWAAADDVSQSFTVAKAAPNCSVAGYSVTYDGDPHTATGSCLGIGGVVLAGLELGATTNTNSGIYPVDPWTFTDVTGNYQDANGTVADAIARADATCKVDAYDVTYDAQSHTATGACTGVKGETLVGLDLSATVHTAAGTYNDAVSFTDITGNYNNVSDSVSDHIGLAPMSLSLGDGTKVYGTTFSGTIFLTQSGLQSGDSVDCERTSAGFDASAAVGNYPISCTNVTGTGLDNYDITYYQGNLKVTPADLDVTADDQGKPYGSTLDLGHVAFHTTGLVNGDTVVGVDLASLGAVSSAAVGTYDITPSNADGSGLENYTVAYDVGTLTVGKASLTITASSPDMTYGQTVPTIDPIITGYVNGDDDSALIGTMSCSTTATSLSAVGSAPATKCEGVTSDEYDITFVPGSVNVKPAGLTVTASSGSFIVGGTPPTITATITGFVGGDDESVLTSAPVCSTTADSSSPVGTYDSTCSGAAADNYTFNYVAGSVTVNPVPVWAISITKSANVSSYTTAGQSIVYTYRVVNTGNQNIGPGQFKVSDDKIGSGTAFNCGSVATLTPNTGDLNDPSAGSFVSCTATYSVTQDDVDFGMVRNTAVGSVTANGRDLTSESVMITVEGSQSHELTLAKAADKSTFTSVGETITYTYTLTNTGNMTLHGPWSVTDDKIASVDCSGASFVLAPGAHTTCTATYAISQTDIGAGTVVNHATAYGHYVESDIASNGTAAEVKFLPAAPTATPTPAAPTATPTPAGPTATPTPAGPTATPTPTAANPTPTPTPTPSEVVGGETATPHQSPTLPSTSTGHSNGGSSTPLAVLLICLCFGGLGLLVVQSQRRSIRG